MKQLLSLLLFTFSTMNYAQNSVQYWLTDQSRMVTANHQTINFTVKESGRYRLENLESSQKPCHFEVFKPDQTNHWESLADNGDPSTSPEPALEWSAQAESIYQLRVSPLGAHQITFRLQKITFNSLTDRLKLQFSGQPNTVKPLRERVLPNPGLRFEQMAVTSTKNGLPYIAFLKPNHREIQVWSATENIFLSPHAQAGQLTFSEAIEGFDIRIDDQNRPILAIWFQNSLRVYVWNGLAWVDSEGEFLAKAQGPATWVSHSDTLELFYVSQREAQFLLDSKTWSQSRWTKTSRRSPRDLASAQFTLLSQDSTLYLLTTQPKLQIAQSIHDSNWIDLNLPPILADKPPILCITDKTLIIAAIEDPMHPKLFQYSPGAGWMEFPKPFWKESTVASNHLTFSNGNKSLFLSESSIKIWNLHQFDQGQWRPALSLQNLVSILPSQVFFLPAGSWSKTGLLIAATPNDPEHSVRFFELP